MAAREASGEYRRGLIMGSRWGQNWGPEMGPSWGFWMGPRMGLVTLMFRPLVTAPRVTSMFRFLKMSH